MANAYNPAKDPKVLQAVALLDSIEADDFLPPEIQLQRLAYVREEAKRRALALRAAIANPTTEA